MTPIKQYILLMDEFSTPAGADALKKTTDSSWQSICFLFSVVVGKCLETGCIYYLDIAQFNEVMSDSCEKPILQSFTGHRRSCSAVGWAIVAGEMGRRDV